VPVKVLRDGKEMNMDITVKELPGSEEMAKANENGGQFERRVERGWRGGH